MLADEMSKFSIGIKKVYVCASQRCAFGIIEVTHICLNYIFYPLPLNPSCRINTQYTPYLIQYHMRNAPFFLGNHHDIIYFKRDHSATAVTSDLVIESSANFIHTHIY